MSALKVKNTRPPEVVAEDSLRLLTATEAAALLKVSSTWIYAASRDGRLPCVRLGDPGGPLRFRAVELLEHLASARSAWTPAQRPGQALRLVSGGGA
ncbi:helix-turn-helix domain-containing protein [Paraconexibacter antarcticus]|uniref:Helix-turn-helix domain-containing protein n=1 Tax=Paraconexibacter antarcticus TaxID=2949664 RepID=A0ABY5DY02_9ACTN|nr:helix-turn-helix domain-containing protein [Paraconexibacter antarcticus]UTI66905.1 helix-turn-helix domain-containing protein [Paraconexibacter antarcticus]